MQILFQYPSLSHVLTVVPIVRIANGVQIANQNGEEGWSFCLACAIKNSDGSSLPDGCDECFSKYCYYKTGTSD